MAYTARFYQFDASAPSHEALRAKAEELAGLPLTLEPRTEAEAWIAFACQDGTATVSVGAQTVGVLAKSVSCSVLLDLLDMSIRDLGGVALESTPRDLPLPLTPEFIRRETDARLAEAQQAARRVRRVVGLIAAAVLAVLVGLAWIALSAG
ncbi:MAG: hypothetical protein AAF845_05895 [Bacteroidota bacterium]